MRGCAIFTIKKSATDLWFEEFVAGDVLPGHLHGAQTGGDLVTTKLVTNNLVTYNLVTDNLVTRQFGNLQFGNLNIMTTPKHIDNLVTYNLVTTNLVTLVFKSTLKHVVHQFELSSPFNQSVNASIAISLDYFLLTSNTLSLVFFQPFY